jgi:RecA/RadA recombinase
MDLKEKRRKIKANITKFLKRHKIEDDETIKIGFMDEDPGIGKLEPIKTGVLPFDIATGGLYKGLINVIYGPKDSGKSTIVRDAMATICTDDTVGAYMNQEKTMDVEYWKDGDVSPDNIVLAQWKTVEQGLDYANSCVDGSSPVDILAIDTVQALSPEAELLGKKGEIKSVGDNTVALIPRVFSQFLREYTSLSVGRLTLLLVSQVRVEGIGSNYVFEGMSGGNAIKHYNLLTVKVATAGKSAWPTAALEGGHLPPNSFPVRFTVDKIKAMGRYKKTSVVGYFYRGKFDKRFNAIYIAKDIGIHDGKEYSYPNDKETTEGMYCKRGQGHRSKNRRAKEDS